MIKKYIVGDLVNSAIEAAKNPSGFQEFVGHGCNCHAAMGSGFAPLIASAFPQVEHADNEMYEKYNRMGSNMGMLGNFSIARVSESLVVLNIYTQYLPGKDLRLWALELGFFNVNQKLREMSKVGVRPVLHIPRIGAGVAGGDWDVISKLIDENTPDIDVVVWVLPGTEVPKLNPSLENLNNL